MKRDYFNAFDCEFYNSQSEATNWYNQRKKVICMLQQ